MALLGACGWGIVHVIDRLTEAPTVEYSVTSRTGRQRGVAVNIRNLSYTNRFKDLKFSLDCRSNDCGTFSNADIVGIPPAFHGGARPDTCQGSELTFVIPNLHPGWRFMAHADYDGDDTPPLRLMYAATEVQLLESSSLTFLLRHQLGFIVSFSAISLCLVAWLVYFGSGYRERNHE